MIDIDRVRFSQAIAALQEENFEVRPGITQRHIRDLATSGQFPAKLIGQVWTLERAALPQLAQALGLKQSKRQTEIAA